MLGKARLAATVVGIAGITFTPTKVNCHTMDAIHVNNCYSMVAGLGTCTLVRGRIT